MSFFGNEIGGQAQDQPRNWTKEHEYWNKIKQKNEARLNAIQESDITSVSNRATEVRDKTIRRGDTLSGILKNEVGLKGKNLLLALVHLKLVQNTNIDLLKKGEVLSVTKQNNNLYLTIKGRSDANNVALFPTFNQAPPVQAPPVQAPPVQAPPVQAPPVQAPPVQAPPVQAPPVQAPPVQAPPVQAPPVQAPPVQAPPVQAPPVQAPPVQAPPVQAPPVQAPPSPEGFSLDDI